MNKKLSITTLNIKGTPLLISNTYKRLKLLAAELSKIDVDIINLQEIFSYYHLYIFKRKLKKYQYCIYDNFIFGPKGGLVTFSRIPIEKKRYSCLPSQKIIKKVFLRKGILISKIKQKPVFIANTHLTANKENNWTKKSKSYTIHQNQIQKLIFSASEFPENTPLILTGDFNISKNSNFYKNLIKETKLRDAFVKSKTPTFHQEFMSKGQKSNIIDFILFRGKNIKTSNQKNLFIQKRLPQKINSGFLSDHIGLKTTFNFKI